MSNGGGESEVERLQREASELRLKAEKMKEAQQRWTKIAVIGVFNLAFMIGGLAASLSDDAPMILRTLGLVVVLLAPVGLFAAFVFANDEDENERKWPWTARLSGIGFVVGAVCGVMLGVVYPAAIEQLAADEGIKPEAAWAFGLLMAAILGGVAGMLAVFRPIGFLMDRFGSSKLK